MVQQSAAAQRVPAIIPGARIRSITDSWNPRHRTMRVRVASAQLCYGAEEDHDRWELTLACGHTLRVCEHELADFFPCHPCTEERTAQEPPWTAE